MKLLSKPNNDQKIIIIEKSLKQLLFAYLIVTDSNNLSYDSKRRIDFACKLFKDDKCDVLITTDGSIADMKNSLAKVMADRAKKIHKTLTQNYS